MRKLQEERELVLTSKGKPIGLLAPLDEASFERTLRVWRQARGMAALAELQQEAKRKGRAGGAPPGTFQVKQRERG
ncbi:MAG: hypothetical protein HYY15_02535 [Candidatus Omnitrophica bacterium]|nr:hypothetical protein [Candidatus Omnitrophota bacterium]